jgi:hypothetical protein
VEETPTTRSEWLAANPPCSRQLTETLAGVARRTRARYDAYLGALAEHLAAVNRLERSAWSIDPLASWIAFWFVSDVPGFQAMAIAQAPAVFRRRGVFIPERSLHRV